MIESWILKQIEFNISQWDSSMENAYPEVKEWNKNSQKYYHHVCEKCNFLDAIKIINWEKYLVEDAMVLDLGCGGGWLSSFLSKFQKVHLISSIDTSKNYLHNIMPEVIQIMYGDKNKIKRIEGLFSPILMEDDSVDLVVASAALHHAENLQDILNEIYKKLKPGGVLMIINETPSSYIKYILRVLRAGIKILFNILFKKYTSISQRICSASFEYDPLLGDKMYPLWYWKEAIKNSNFELIEFIDSKMPTVKGIKQESLKHFICKKKV